MVVPVVAPGSVVVAGQATFQWSGDGFVTLPPEGSVAGSASGAPSRYHWGTPEGSRYTATRSPLTRAAMAVVTVTGAVGTVSSRLWTAKSLPSAATASTYSPTPWKS